MDLEYDSKFDEMKKYVPFLENMIKRLENTSSGSSNPRQAQLDKIKSLRDLLLDKKKRMKMDNLLKCEQVLVNLYAKVEQKDKLSDNITEDSKSKENTKLEIVRNKLKNVTKNQADDSLPEIARADEIPETSMAGSKEPALFQRRPNKNSLSPGRIVSKSPTRSSSREPSIKRNYTRVLVSPESSPQRWTKQENNSSEKPLYSRRSPRKSPKRHSPTLQERKKKSSKSSRKQQDLNITLKVPEESLLSLNTKDILSRIITCSDGDVDIDTLRELRTQILGELNKTGASEDISDLILQTSCKKIKPKEKVEIEEGELSDSESETIENIYGSLVILDKDQKTSSPYKITNKDDKKPRKIQIRLVINSDNDIKPDNNTTSKEKGVDKNEIDKSEFEMYQGEKVVENVTNSTIAKESKVETPEKKCDDQITTSEVTSEAFKKGNENILAMDDNERKVSSDSKNVPNADRTKSNIPYKPNFYKPLTEQVDTSKDAASSSVSNKSCQDESIKSSLTQSEKKNTSNVITAADENNDKIGLPSTVKNDVEIPLLNEPSVASRKPKESVVSEIDILQALKKEILSESIDIPGADVTTPPLHQPKLIKVASAQEIVPKKRISIENYKQKSSGPSVSSLSSDSFSSCGRDEHVKKQSLKLTEKEFERFKSILNDNVSSDDDNGNDSIASVDDIYADLAPKSPDDDIYADIGTNTPVIIPNDPVERIDKTVEVSIKSDIDMRSMHPLASPQFNAGMSMGNLTPTITDTCSIKDNTSLDHNKSNLEKIRPLLVDPRMKKNLNQNTLKENLNQYMVDMAPKPIPPPVNFSVLPPAMASHMISNINTSIIPGMSQSKTASISPNIAPNMTPSMTPRPYEMTPQQIFETDNQPKRKHVYASLYDSDFRDQSVARDSKGSHWEKQDHSVEFRNNKRWDEFNDSRNWDDCSKSGSVQRDTQDFQKYNRYNDSYHYSKYKISRNDRYSIDRREQRFARLDPSTPSYSYGRSECPLTPSHPFSRSDCPPTPNPSFGRSDCPPTPNHSFGDCPPTPNHAFGRTECPLTPSHSFGRSECPPTPNPAFGRSESTRSEMPMTPSHPFGRIDRDPRLKRNSEYESNSQNDDMERDYRNRNMSFGSYNSSYKNTDSQRNYREKGDRRYDRNRYYSQDQNDQHYGKDQIARSDVNRYYDGDKLYSRDRKSGTDYHNDREKSRIFSDAGSRQSYQCERSVGRNYVRTEETFVRSTSRAPSVGRSFEGTDNDNTLSVKSHAGRSFTIDTSVNTTFQDFLNKNSLEKGTEYTFDARRQRATSVGRTFVRETSVGNTFSQSYQLTNTKINENMTRNFRRARSVVRDTDDLKMNKSFSEIKADFKSYKYKEIRKNTSDFVKHEDMFPQKDNAINARLSSKIDENINYQPKQSYSPRKNNRDPRLNRESHDDNSKNRNDKYKMSRDRKKHGIVYSNENIVSGRILGSGYGVKNYKIPKIKRDTEIEKKEVVLEKSINTENKQTEKPLEEVKQTEKQLEDKMKENVIEKNKKELILKRNSKVSKSKGSEGKQTDITKANQPITLEPVERRITRSSKKSESEVPSENEDIIRIKNAKRPIQDYDSDAEDISKPSTDTILTNDKELQEGSVVNQLQTEQDEALDSSFGVDDLEMFSDNIADPVLDNINALIADLDEDLNISKKNSNNNFRNEITFENMLDNISSSVITSPNKQGADEISLSDITEIIKNDSQENDSNENTQNKSITLRDVSGNNIDADNSPQLYVTNHREQKNQYDKFDEIRNDLNESSTAASKSDIKDTSETSIKSISEDIVKDSNEDFVSTTEVVEPKVYDEKENTIDQNNSVNSDYCSTPDSTDNVVPSNKSIVHESLPDSTNEMNSDITSSHDPTETVKDDVEPNSTNKNTVPEVDSMKSILSILQNKSKIKELLSMLGDQSSNNEKIKKKLEKLSEIVSDDEDIKDDTDQIAIENKANDKVSDSNVKESEIVDADVEKKVTDVKDSTSSLSDKEENVIDTNENKTLENNIIENELTDAKEIAVSKNEEDINNENKDALKIDALKIPEKNSEINQTEPIVEVIQSPKSTGTENKPCKKVHVKKRKRSKSGKFLKKKLGINRVTRSANTNVQQPKKKVSRELLKLQEDIKEMFISDDVLNATGIRMCRLAKLVDEKTTNQKENLVIPDTEPVVVLEKFKSTDVPDDIYLLDNKAIKGTKKKAGPKSRVRVVNDNTVDIENKIDKSKTKYKPGPKSKTKVNKNLTIDPYEFETDSFTESSVSKLSEGSIKDTSDSESESLASSKSFGSSEVLPDLKKKTKRKRPGWNAGIIKPKHKKRKKDNTINEDRPQKMNTPIIRDQISIPDMNCFTDRTYCFLKNVNIYSCRLCVYKGNEIVAHYKKQHPHSEIPLSRLNQETAKEAIDQCEDINFQAINKVPTNKFICRFCFRKEFGQKKNALESFFWHVVSMHTGEYKQPCSECIDITECSFNLDIPPPPKDTKGQLMGYICGKCNFTQISLENLKTHVIVRHNDEQTEVYSINLAVMTKNMMNMYSKRVSIFETEQPRVLRSSRYNQSMTETSDERSDATDTNEHSVELAAETAQPIQDKKRNKLAPKSNFKSKITFENDDSVSEMSNINNTSNVTIKEEKVDEEDKQEKMPTINKVSNEESIINSESADVAPSDDIFVYPHFKVTYTETGNKEFVCCINGNDNHYKTTLLISMKKHVQLKHKEKWDGYCFVCKVIVTPQGQHLFKDCLEHFLDKHMDDFPVLVLEKVAVEPEKPEEAPVAAPKPYINVRPISELKEINPNESVAVLPKIESVVSLGAAESVPNFTATSTKESQPVPLQPQQLCKYEEVQADVISKKHPIVLETMMVEEKLVNVYKCAGRFCSFTTDSAEVALVHALTHQQIGGENALRCAYCDFDCANNPIDLVVHVFKHSPWSFVCGYCFYRAVASQLVVTHIARCHSDQPIKILRSTKATSPPAQEISMLPREVAVPYYVCTYEHNHVRCKFRTYTARKFCEHLQNAHDSSTGISCEICYVQNNSASDVIQHMKIHDYNLYQCTWCRHGADNESELLAHAAALHPDRPPQAYLRIITTKEGSSEYRVLPLASFNKSKMITKAVTPSNSNDNPAREADRSIELEKLIGFTTQLTSKTDAQPNLEKERQNNSTLPESLPQMMATPEPQVVLPPPQVALPPATPPSNPTPQLQADLSRQTTPVLKTEPSDSTPVKYLSDDVVCLDSDDESSKQTEVNLFDDVVTASTSKCEGEIKKLPESKLFQCPKCNLVFKNASGLKIHLISCYGGIVLNVPCAHCPKMLKNRDTLVTHYVKNHSGKNNLCGICGYANTTLASIKKHVKRAHKIEKIQVTTKYTADGNVEHVVDVKHSEKPIRATKRKLSLSSSEPQAKLKRYGPQDIDLLPINPILDDLVYCSLCGFSTKVRLNMVRHLQFHAEQQPVPQTAPVNPVPHLETNEKHFDKMVNLASSSIVTRGPEKTTRSDMAPVVSLLISAEDASRYPKYVPERQRHTCGAKGCSYISLDEAMLRCHWETLHSGSNDYHCVHCPPYQHLDTSKPLTASRIIAHLKMHDTTLYACSSCSYYHYKRQVVEKHQSDVHKGGQVVVVREEATPIVQASQPSVSAPTMDLKPWQCGLCKFKSMLRPEVVDHCAKIHQSKMQYKCTYCPFRTSTLENVTKHQTNSHPGKIEDIFYYYYREGSIPDDADSSPRWMKQRQKSGILESEVKTEVPDPVFFRIPSSTQPKPPVEVDLNIVKKEVDTNTTTELSIEDLCKKYGDFCDTNGLKYKCPLCKVVTEDSKESMQSHLYEELQYRKWGCVVCSYKAFHKTGLQEHMSSEHRGQYQSAKELPLDINIENWVTGLLNFQTQMIERNKENLAKQRIQQPPAVPSTSKPTQVQTDVSSAIKANMIELEQAFGPFSAPSNMLFSCPKCSFKVKDEVAMRDHLESELTKIRWCCNKCSSNFQTYHEVQFHCKSVHSGLSARPVEAIRDPAIRASWVATVIQVQKVCLKNQAMETVESSPEKADGDAMDNSLLVVRYEENVTMPDEIARRKRPAPTPSADSDNETLLIDEPSDDLAVSKKTGCKKCPYCDFHHHTKSYSQVMNHHILRHYNLKPYTCRYCDFNGYKLNVGMHIQTKHPNLPVISSPTPIPSGAPLILNLNEQKNKKTVSPADECQKNVCLICEKLFTDTETLTHCHDKEKPCVFAKKGDVVVKCCICLVLRKNVVSLQEHHNSVHGDVAINYAYFKLLHDTREIQSCEHCKKSFKFIKDLRRHHNAVHSSLTLKYKTVPFVLSAVDVDDNDDVVKVIPPPVKRVAKKSTTKLPTQSIAKKSTTKLPVYNTELEYSYYGTKRDSLEKFRHVTTLMPFYNRMMPFNMKKLSELIDIDPKVLVKDINK
ncbi:LOW QUALITY PROTEIN: uncharacterized protein ACR2FA_002089 [Aphomia sociella]